MGPEQKKIVLISWSIAIFVIFIWSTFDTFRLLWAIYHHPHLKISQVHMSDSARTDFRRSEQKYFLDYGVYVPLEDIMYVDQLPQDGARYSTALKKGCSGLGVSEGVAIWLPVRVKLPLIGEKVSEWCWKPVIAR